MLRNPTAFALNTGLDNSSSNQFSYKHTQNKKSNGVKKDDLIVTLAVDKFFLIPWFIFSFWTLLIAEKSLLGAFGKLVFWKGVCKRVRVFESVCVEISEHSLQRVLKHNILIGGSIPNVFFFQMHFVIGIRQVGNEVRNSIVKGRFFQVEVLSAPVHPIGSQTV